tara:strand:- start:131 stop:832 length:702 start_codon:yes stop_codon:yes gene_type:complete
MDFESIRLKKIYNKFPVNMRIFAETVAGVDRPITEEDFTPQDLTYLRSIIENTQKKNTEMENMLVEHRDLISEMGVYELGPDKNLVDITDKEISGLNKKIQSYRDTSDRTSVQYTDINRTADPRTESAGALMDDESIARTVKDSFNDPAYRIKTTLGRFTAEHQDDGSIIVKDTYDWNELDVEKPTFKEFIAAVPELASNPRKAGNAFMRLIKPDTSREVRIQLDSKKGMLTE